MTGFETEPKDRSLRDPLLTMQNVSKSYAKKEIFSNLSLTIGTHEFVTLLGPSGCGKSTLLRTLGALEIANTGSLVQLPNLQCSFVFQEPRLLPWRNVLENTLLPVELQASHEASLEKSKIQEKARNILDLLKLSDSLNKFPQELSGGMKMRTAIARSLMLSPDLLLLDEPFSALDEDTRFFLQQEIRKLFDKGPFSVIFVTHSLEEALFLSDRILIFQKPGQGLMEFIPSFAHPNAPAARDFSLKNDLLFFEGLKTLRQTVSGAQE